MNGFSLEKVVGGHYKRCAVLLHLKANGFQESVLQTLMSFIPKTPTNNAAKCSVTPSGNLRNS